MRLKKRVFIYPYTYMDLLTDILSTFFVTVNEKPSTEKKSTCIVEQDSKSRVSLSSSSSLDTSSLNTKNKQNKIEDESTMSSMLSSSSSSLTLSKKLSSNTVSSISSIVEKDDYVLEKYIIKGKDISLKPIILLNSDQKDNVNILADLLDKLGGMSDLYSENLYIMTQYNMKYKKMLLENPYLHFNDYHIKREYCEEWITNKYNKRTVFVIDYELLKDVEQIINRDDIHLVITSNVYSNEIGKMLNDIRGILINRKNKVEILQKQFYKNIVKNVCNLCFSTFEEYYDNINDENLGVRWIILNDNKLMYN